MGKKLTTEEFIEKAVKVHGDKYDYSQTIYLNSLKEVEIICKIHGSFKQIAANHINIGHGCILCGNLKRASARAYSDEDFIKLATYVHGDRYDYSKIEYKNYDTKITIICKKHKEFEQSPYNHLKGSGCPKCAAEKPGSFMPKFTTEEFILRAQKVHGDKYDYSNSIYVGIDDKIDIICPIHDLFQMTPYNHINRKSNCPKCANNRISNEDFIKKAKSIHGEKYDYSLTNFISFTKKIIIICPLHSNFEIYPGTHLRSNCDKCAIENSTMNFDEFLDRARSIHGDKYNYSKCNYINSKTRVNIICEIHGSFWQTPYNHIHCNCGCQSCLFRTSVKEINWLNSLNIDTENRNINVKVSNYHRKNINVDGFDPKNNTCYLFHGDFWHGNPKIYNRDALNKVINKTFGEIYDKTMCIEKILKSSGYNIVRIWESEWDKISKDNK